MSFTDDQFVEKVRQANDIVDVIGDYVELKKSGKIYKGICPFHEEKTPGGAFTVYPDTQSFFCFSCDSKGDVFEFIQKKEGYTFQEALEFLAKRAGIEFSPRRETKKQKEINSETLFTELMSSFLNEHEKIQKEAKEKKLEDFIVQKIRINIIEKKVPHLKGLRPLELDLIKNWLKEKWKISLSSLNEELKESEGKARDIKEKKIETLTLIPDLIHLVKEDKKVKYLVLKEGKLYIRPTYILDGKFYKPMQKLPIQLPGPEILKEPMEIDYKKLFEEVISYIKSYLEMPHDYDYFIMALWVFHTYLIEKFNSTPLLYFYGVIETGKTRAGEVLYELAFRCERLTSPSEASIFREADYFKTSLIIDEIKLWGLDGDKEVARLIKSRYKRGLLVPRVNLNKTGEDQIEYFDVFGPLVICTTEGILDAIENRSIQFIMKKNTDPKVEPLPDKEWARKLRNKLIIFRANQFDKPFEDTELVARRRLGEIMTPLYQVLMLIDPQRKEEFNMILEEMQKKREEETSFSLEAEIVDGIIKYKEETNENVFLTTELTGRLNKDKTEKEKFSNRLIAIRTERLGFEKIRVGGQKRGFKINNKLLLKLKLQFGI